jgi:tRNA threonylcarbamoyladenosine biosynthesis protein TsaB
MLILGLDTSGKNGSLALLRFDAGTEDGCGAFETVDLVTLAGGSYSAELVPRLATMLERHGLRHDAIDAYSVASGPGSFTGLRVGLSTVKALADASSKPIVAITVLEAVAWEADHEGRIFVVLDAGRKQVFVGEFLCEGRMRTPLSEQLVETAAFAEKLKNDSAIIFTPDAQLADALLPTGRTISVVPQPAADLYARIGAERVLAGNTISPAELDAHYSRRSDAEIFFKGPR